MNRRQSNPSSGRSNRAPARTDIERENHLISLAADLAERQLREGTASSQVIVNFLKLGSSREKLEQERIRHENELLRTKREILESEKRVEELYAKALNAMRSYSGDAPEEPEQDYDEYEE